MKNSGYIIAFVAILAIGAGAAVFGGFGFGGASTDTKSALPAAPQFELKDYNGNAVRMSDFKGKPVIVNAWATWCPFCVNELADFAAVQDKYGDSLVVIAIDRAEGLGVAKNFTDKLGLTDKYIFLLDPRDSFYRSIGGFSMPETIFVGRDGNIRDHKRGPMKRPEIMDRLKKIL